MDKRRKDDVTNAIDDETKRHLALKYDHFTCKVNAEEYADYSKEKLELLRTNCSEFYPCTQELNKSKNFHLIRSGKTIQLSTFCRLLYTNMHDNYDLHNICSVKERQALAQSIGEALDHELNESPPSATAFRFRRCISSNKRGSEKNIDTVCRIRMNANWTRLCRDRSFNNLSETVFNNKLERLHCMCSSLPPPTNSVRDKSVTYIGAACGASVLTILFIIVVFLCCRRRKIKRNKSPSLPALLDDSLAPAYIRSCPEVYDAFSGETEPTTRQTPALSVQVPMPVDKSSAQVFGPVEKSSTQVIMPVTKSFHSSKELLQTQAMVSESDPVYSEPFSGISSGRQLRAVSNCNPTYYVNCPSATGGQYICMSHTTSCQCRQFTKSQYDNLATEQITDNKIFGDCSRHHPKVLENEYI